MQLHNDKITTLRTAIQTAYQDHTINSNLAYRPEFISNNYKLGKKVLVSIEEELQRCEEFCISVAFITKSGITPLLQTLKDLEQRNIPGKILTTNYLMFSEPEALEKLAGLKNIELKMFVVNGEYPECFHCIVCGGKDNLDHFSSRLGGVICSKCREGIHPLYDLAGSVLYTMQYIIATPVEHLYTFQVTEEVQHKLRRLMDIYMKDHIDREFHSLDILKTLEIA